MDEEVTFSGRFFLFVPIWSKPFVGKICILTTYDIFCMYIYGMRNGKMTYEMNECDKKDIVFGLVVPFVLYWTFFVLYFLIDDFFLRILSFFPYYFYLVVVMGLFVGGGVSRNRMKMSNFISVSLLLSFVTSGLLFVIGICFGFNGVGFVSLIHGVFSMLSLIGQLITENVYFNPGHVGYVDYGD